MNWRDSVCRVIQEMPEVQGFLVTGNLTRFYCLVNREQLTIPVSTNLIEDIDADLVSILRELIAPYTEQRKEE